jgi:hypothetical protein
MIVHWHQATQVIQVGLQLIGIGTILRASPKGFQWLYKQYKDSLENRVLRTFYDMDDGPWQSAHGVVGDLGIRAAISDAPGFLMPATLKGWRLYVHWLKVAPYRWRHAFRRTFVIPSKEKADKVLFDLWERGLLIRAGWDHTKNQFYRLKN